MGFSHANDNEKTQSFFSLLCESGKFSPYIHVDEATAVKSSCQDNGRRNTITCKDKDLAGFLIEVDSLNMNTANLKGTNLLIGEYIPVIPKVFFKSPETFVSNKIVGVSISDIFVGEPLELRDGRYRVSPNLKININVLQNPVFQNKKVILMFDARDALLEHLWWKRDDIKLFDTLAKIKFFAITTPNFSLFKGECPIGHAWNIKKGLLCGVELEKRGVIVVPHVYAVHQEQLVRWCDWLKKNPTVKIIAMNCQLQRKSIDGRNIAVSALRYLLENTDVDIILNGSDKRILLQLEQFKIRLHSASSGVFKKLEIKKMMNSFIYKNWMETSRKVSVTL